MRHEDLGVLTGPILIFGGAYSNAQATRALLAKAACVGISGQNLIFTGDVIAYCGAPTECVNMLRASKCSVVAGNCEIQLAAGEMDCGCGFEEGTSCDLLSKGWFTYANGQIRADDRRWMGQLPDIMTFHHDGLRYAVIHGGIRDVARFIWKSSEEAIFTQEWQEVEAQVGPVDRILAGHCGIPFVHETLSGTWINAGVIGMPPHDQNPQTRYVTIENATPTIHALDYDVEAAVQDMVAAGLTQGYEKSLLSGIWPSEDILPADLRLDYSNEVLPVAKG